MKTTALNLALLDDSTLMGNTLSAYLTNRFGARVNVSVFYDADRCMRETARDTHVIVLDYAVDGKARKNGTEKFNYIKTLHPEREVSLIVSDDEAGAAIEEVQREASEYIIDREGYSRNIVHHINKKVVKPIKTFVAYPISQIAHYYSVQNYLMMFVVAFISVGGLVLAGLFAVRLFEH